MVNDIDNLLPLQVLYIGACKEFTTTKMSVHMYEMIVY